MRWDVFHRILVACDGSSSINNMLELTADLANRHHASVVLLHAFPHVSDVLGTPMYEQLLEGHTLFGEQLLEAARARLPKGVPVETQLLEGPAAEAILRVADQEHCDLIIVGTHGRGKLAELFGRSVSHTIMHEAVCPVLIVHPNEQDAEICV